MIAKQPKTGEGSRRVEHHSNIRKRLRKEAERVHGRNTRWIGGILHFSKTRTPVPDVPHVPKPGRRAVGIEGAEPGRVRRAERWDPEPSRKSSGRSWDDERPRDGRGRSTGLSFRSDDHHYGF